MVALSLAPGPGCRAPACTGAGLIPSPPHHMQVALPDLSRHLCPSCSTLYVQYYCTPTSVKRGVHLPQAQLSVVGLQRRKETGSCEVKDLHLPDLL
eukprot:1155261-Pelagomonas_calceolata.AAC.2